jgi:hypothetical protein
LIYVIENYYSLRGIPYYTARYVALQAIVGWVDLEYPSVCESMSWDPVVRHMISEEDAMEEFVEEDDEKLLVLIQTLQSSVASTFQKQLSKRIRVVDLPKVVNLESKLDEVVERLKDVADLGTSSDMNPELLPNYRNGINAPPHNNKSKIKRKARPTTRWLHIRDGAGYPMHQRKHILAIFDQDRSFMSLSRPALTLLQNMDSTMVAEDDESVLSMMDKIFNSNLGDLDLGGDSINSIPATFGVTESLNNALLSRINNLNINLGIKN